MVRNFAIALAFVPGTAVFAAQSTVPTKAPIEVKIVSVPSPPQPSQTSDVKIVSMPAMPQVRVVVPPDEATIQLVSATRYLFWATVALSIATFAGSWWQSRDTKRRGRVAMLREVRRNANRVMMQATRLKQVAERIPAARNRLSVLLHQGGMPATVKEEIDKSLKERSKALDHMVNGGLDIVSSNLSAESDRDLTAHLWRLDAHDAQLDMLREAIDDELSRYESESLTIREHNAAMQAAALGAKLGAPVKTALG